VTEPPTAPTPARPRVRWARWAALVAALVVVALGVVAASRFGTDPTLVDSPLIGQPAPTPTLPYLGQHGEVGQEGELPLASLTGQVLVVNFWASWCVPCREEHAALTAAANAYRDAGVRFVGVLYQDEPDGARAFLDELGWGEGYHYVTDSGSRAAVDFGVFGAPETFFIDSQGRIVAKITGPSTVDLLARTLDQILAGQTPESAQTGEVQPGPGEP
jgi:cytochrome c biogenesis protein CcmG/thiol:disulfide interchange protein DsbE